MPDSSKNHRQMEVSLYFRHRLSIKKYELWLKAIFTKCILSSIISYNDSHNWATSHERILYLKNTFNIIYATWSSTYSINWCKYYINKDCIHIFIFLFAFITVIYTLYKLRCIDNLHSLFGVLMFAFYWATVLVMMIMIWLSTALCYTMFPTCFNALIVPRIHFISQAFELVFPQNISFSCSYHLYQKKKPEQFKCYLQHEFWQNDFT